TSRANVPASSGFGVTLTVEPSANPYAVADPPEISNAIGTALADEAQKAMMGSASAPCSSFFSIRLSRRIGLEDALSLQKTYQVRELPAIQSVASSARGCGTSGCKEIRRLDRARWVAERRARPECRVGPCDRPIRPLESADPILTASEARRRGALMRSVAL